MSLWEKNRGRIVSIKEIQKYVGLSFRGVYRYIVILKKIGIITMAIRKDDEGFYTTFKRGSWMLHPGIELDHLDYDLVLLTVKIMQI